MSPRRRALAIGATLVGPLAACGGGPGTIHPAHVVPEATVVFGAGVTGRVASGELDAQISRGRALSAAAAPSPEPEQAFVDGAVTSALIGPGVAPWVGGRVGLGARSEGLLTYAGRTLYAGARHAFQDAHYALSIGGGASAHLLRPPSSDPADRPEPTAGRFEGRVDEARVTGFGLDVPIIGGYRSSGDIFAAWAGTRIGIDWVSGALPLSPEPLGETERAVSAHLSGHRWFAGGLAGLAVGMSPIWVGVQVDGAYHSVTGRVETDDPVDPLDYSVRSGGLVLTPSGIIWGKF
jgi:hypothetical protein